MTTPGYVPLTRAQQSAVKRIKQAEVEFAAVLDAELKLGADPRCVATSKTKMQEARFFAVEAVTAAGKYAPDVEQEAAEST